MTGVNFGLGGLNVLVDIDPHRHPGYSAGLVGSSGAGKTSLLKLVLPLSNPREEQNRA